MFTFSLKKKHFYTKMTYKDKAHYFDSIENEHDYILKGAYIS